VHRSGSLHEVVHLTTQRYLLTYAALLILVLALAVPVSANIRTLNPGDSIQASINSAGSGDTIVLNPGTYKQYGITLDRPLTIRANTSYGGTPANTVIDGMSGGSSIINTTAGTTVVLDNLTFSNGTATDGGAVYNYGNLFVNSSVFRNCSATGPGYPHGGAIANNVSGTLAVDAGTFTGCSAMYGGAINSWGTISSIANTTFVNCSASQHGGAISNVALLSSITTTTFANCSASNGGAIGNWGTISSISSSTLSATGASSVIYNQPSGSISALHFCRIYHDGSASVIDNWGSDIDATNNWWGSNSNPSGFTFGGVIVSPWLVLNITAMPSSITGSQTSKIRINLTNNSAGTDTTSGGIFVPDGIPVAFARTSGTGSISPHAGNITSGANTTTFTPAGPGTSTVAATVDDQSVTTSIHVASLIYTLNPGDSIQSAINAADPGDTIILNPGTYNQYGITLDRSLTLRANTSYGGTPANTVINGMSRGSEILTIAGGTTAVLDNLTFFNGTADFGGAVTNSGNLSVNSSVFRNCSAAKGFYNRGGAIYNTGNLTVASSTFFNCSAWGEGGAIYNSHYYCYEDCGDDSGYIRYTISISSSSFSDCSAYNGGAIYNDKGTISSISSSSFSNCSGIDLSGDYPGAGGAIYNVGPISSISSSSFSDCSATLGGAIINVDNISSISSSSFSDCSATNGGAIVNFDNISSFTSSSFSDCSATNGGAIENFGTISSFTSSSFSDCSATNGGAIENFGAISSIHFSRIFSNTPTAVNTSGSTVDASDNWWGSNANPSGYTAGGVTVTPWLVLNSTAVPSSIGGSQTAKIRVNLTRNSAGTDTTSGGIFVPDGIPVAFVRTSGTGSIQPAAGKITTGANTTTFTPAGPGTSTVSATVDGETVSADITVTGTTTETRIGVVRSNTTWLLDASGDGKFGAGDLTRTFGKAGDIPVTGDWDGNGITKIGVVRSNTTWLLDASGDGKFGAGDLTYTFGKAGDVPITGDWDGDLATEIGVVRSSTTWLLDASGDGKYGAGDFTYTFGKAGDKPVTGDWSGTPATEIGVVRSNTTWLLDASGDGKYGAGDLTYTFGKAGDKPVIGDWDADVTSEIGVVRSNTTWLLDASGDGKYGAGDLTYTFGKAGDKPVTGKWT
jgi:hypothetical protein